MLPKIIIQVILVYALAILRIGFISALPGAWSGLELFIPAAVLLIGYDRHTSALWFALVYGLFSDVLSFSPFGLETVAVVSAVLASYAVYRGFVTNQSLYSFLAMSATASLVYQMIFLLANKASQWLGAGTSISLDFGYWSSQVKIMGMNLFLMVMLFYLVNFLSKRYQPVFLNKR